MARDYTLGVRLSTGELDALEGLRQVRNMESLGQTVRALIREASCEREEEKAASGTANHADVATD